MRALPVLLESTVQDIDPNMLIPLEGMGCTEQEDQIEEIPLQFHVGVELQIDACEATRVPCNGVECPPGKPSAG